MHSRIVQEMQAQDLSFSSLMHVGVSRTHLRSIKDALHGRLPCRLGLLCCLILVARPAACGHSRMVWSIQDVM
jgi:hypothetical protein